MSATTMPSSARCFPACPTSVLGHIHRPQQLAGTPVTHYAGSPIPLDFGEAGEAKSLVLVEATPGNVTRTHGLGIEAGRPLRELRGSLSEIERAAADVGKAIVRVAVISDDPIDNLQAIVRELMPDATITEVLEDVASRRLEILTPDTDHGGRELTYEELLDGYLANVGTGTAPAAQVRDLFASLRSAETDDRGCHPSPGSASFWMPRCPSRPLLPTCRRRPPSRSGHEAVDSAPARGAFLPRRAHCGLQRAGSRGDHRTDWCREVLAS